MAARVAWLLTSPLHFPLPNAISNRKINCIREYGSICEGSFWWLLERRQGLARRGYSRAFSSKAELEVDNDNDSAKFPWLRGTVPYGYWADMANQRHFVDWLGRRLGYSTLEDWYKVTKEDFHANYGGGLLSKKYKNSPYALLASLIPSTSTSPSTSFFPWKFNTITRNYFDKKENRKQYLDWLKETVGAKALSELKISHFQSNGGLSLLAKYGGSIQRIIDSLNESESLVEKKPPLKRKDSGSYPKNYWDSLENQRAFMVALGEKLGVKELSGWYGVTARLVARNGGKGLVVRYNDSIDKLLSAVFPGYDWLPWKFTFTPMNAWKDPEVLKKAVALLAKELQITKSEQWRRVTTNQLREYGLDYIFERNGGVDAVLRIVRPPSTENP